MLKPIMTKPLQYVWPFISNCIHDETESLSCIRFISK